jgi:membrane-associated phospholipid phosphatase
MSVLFSVNAQIITGNKLVTNALHVGNTLIDSDGISTTSTIHAPHFVSTGDSVVDGNLYVTGQVINSLPPAPLTQPEYRQVQCYTARVTAAQTQYNVPLVTHYTNGDETLYPTYIAQFSKGLQHDSLGNPVLSSYNTLLTAVTTGLPYNYDAIVLGGAAGKMINPQAANSIAMEGADGSSLYLAPPPAFASDSRAAEEVEVYWAALTRDVNFSDYGTNATVAAACADLSSQAAFSGPKVGGQVTAATLFRIGYPGDLTGPYVSQFLYQPFSMGAHQVTQVIRVPQAGAANNFLQTAPQVLGVESGGPVTQSTTWDPVLRYIRNGRDLAEWVHNDFSYQCGMYAVQVLTSLGCPVNVGNPYKTSTTQNGFSTFGHPHVLDLVAKVATQALRAAWFQKWNVHRTLRPEEFALRIHQQKTGAASYPISSQVLNSNALAATFDAQGSYLLSQAYPEGCPRHPAYPSGHATISGAVVTLLKAWYDGSFVIAAPKVPADDGLSLLAYSGATLTVENELNKLAVNIAQGRVIAGVHYLSDSTGGITLGEQVAIAILRDEKLLYSENFAGFTFTKFDGTVITV